MSKIMITGGESMIGRHLVEILADHHQLDNCPHSKVDFTNPQETAERFKRFQPDYVISLAGYNGGIQMNAEKPAEIYMKNAQMALNILSCAVIAGTKGFCYTLPSCAYPSLDGEIAESDFWSGPCAESVECHGLAKSHFYEYSRQLFKQFGFISVGCCLNTVYGPHDKFGENAKVMGGMIKKFVDAKESNAKEVTLWGDGSAKRGFIYASDAANAITHVITRNVNPMQLINIPSEEISTKDLAELIKAAVGFDGEIKWDTTKPNGQMRKMLNSTLSQTMLRKFKCQVSLKDGVQKTVDWYIRNKDKAKQ